MVEQLMAGAADVVHDFVAPLFLQRLTHAAGDVVEHFVPTDPLPLAFAALADALQRITNAFGIANLVERRRPLGAVAAAAAGMLGIALEAANLVRVFFDHRNQAAGRFAIETNGWNDPAVLLDFARPLRRVVLDPVVPLFHRRIVDQTMRFQFQCIGI